jgi:hypothetical protein
MWYFLGLLHSKDILLCYSISQMSINTTILLCAIWKDIQLKLTCLSYKQSKSFSSFNITDLNKLNNFEILPSYHCDSVIVVIIFHKWHNIRNCAFCWNSSTFGWHNFFSVNIKHYTEVDQQRFVEKIRNGSHVLYQYTMCYMKCKQVSYEPTV